MRFHILSLPHTQTLRRFDHCAFTGKVRKFTDMMSRRGHEVILYASEEHDTECSELVTCITREQQQRYLGEFDWWRQGAVQYMDWDPNKPYWQLYLANAIRGIRHRIEPRDFILLTMGQTHRLLIDIFSDVPWRCVEFGVGYEGTYCQHRVFESYAWMHSLYCQGSASGADGRFYDRVIPNYYDSAEFLGPVEPDDYFLFLSRMVPRKGYQIAVDVTRELATSLKIAGVAGDVVDQPHVEHVGLVWGAEKSDLIARARALFVPTIYIEPFGGVAAEAMLCGVPVITTDWGAFPELVEQGVDGFRCHTMREFQQAALDVELLDRDVIRERAIRRFSYDAVAPRYERYFEDLTTLWGRGFYEGFGAR